jgi:hypothetical protein
MKKDILGADCELLGSDDLLVQAIATLDTFDECAYDRVIVLLCAHVYACPLHRIIETI